MTRKSFRVPFFLRLPHVRRKLLGSVLAQAIETAEGRLPPDFGRDLTFVVYDHTGQRVYVHQRPGQHAVPDPKTALATAELWDVLPGWTVRLVYSDPKGGKYPRDIWVANTLLLVLTGTIAVAGALLAMRYMMRQVELANLKAHFVSNITHELKTPLAAIRLYTETLQQGRIQDPVQEREFLGIIQKESGRLEQLIHNILDFARIDSGQRRYTFEPAAVGDVVRDVVEAYSLPLRAQGFAVRLDIHPRVPEVWMDRAAFKGAILNLLDNAAKYSRERKQIEVRVACTGQGAEADGASGQAGAFGAEGRASAIGVEGRADALGAEGQSDPFGAAETSDAAAAGALDTGTAPDAGAAREVEIRVRDRGIGIQAAETGKIFEAFYRVEKGLDQEVQGAGLGLALVKHVVEAHGGSIGVESSRGEGSAFTIRLPVRERPPAPAPARNGAALGRHVSRLGWKPAAPRRGA